MKPYTSRKKKRSLNRLGGKSRSGVKLRVESPDDPERQPNHVVSIDHTHDGTIMHVFKHKEGGYYGDNNKFDFHRDNAKDLHKTLKDWGYHEKNTQVGKLPSLRKEETTTAAAGIPADTKDMGPRFTAHNVMDRRKKKRPAVLKRFKVWLDALPPEARP